MPSAELFFFLNTVKNAMKKLFQVFDDHDRLLSLKTLLKAGNYFRIHASPIGLCSLRNPLSHALRHANEESVLLVTWIAFLHDAMIVAICHKKKMIAT